MSPIHSHCQRCGTPFALDADPRRKWCSNTCRHAAWEKRQRDELRDLRARLAALGERV